MYINESEPVNKRESWTTQSHCQNFLRLSTFVFYLALTPCSVLVASLSKTLGFCVLSLVPWRI